MRNAVVAGRFASEPQDVGDVLRATGCPLACDQVLAADERHNDTSENDLDSASPRGVEIHAGDLREQVDAIRRVSQLHDAIVRCQVVMRDTDTAKAELFERDQEPVRVGGVRPDPRVEVTGRPWQA